MAIRINKQPWRVNLDIGLEPTLHERKGLCQTERFTHYDKSSNSDIVCGGLKVLSQNAHDDLNNPTGLTEEPSCWSTDSSECELLTLLWTLKNKICAFGDVWQDSLVRVAQQTLTSQRQVSIVVAGHHKRRDTEEPGSTKVVTDSSGYDVEVEV